MSESNGAEQARAEIDERIFLTARSIARHITASYVALGVNSGFMAMVAGEMLLDSLSDLGMRNRAMGEQAINSIARDLTELMDSFSQTQQQGAEANGAQAQ